jgi:DNA invertase Pin-like site-specific DNA recombinase
MGNIEKDLSCRNVLSVELVAAYVRVSTQEQKLHGLSLDAQKMKLSEYAEKNNMKIVEWYVDEGVSARKLIRKRPELQRMIQDAEKGKFDRIIFIKLDRFFRSVAEYHECMKRISPVVWTTTEEEYDLTTANGRMLVNMKLTIAELEADMAGERIDLVNEYKVQTGQPLSGSQPFGYMIATDESTGRKKIVRDPDDEEALRDVIQYYMNHQSIKKALVYLHTKYHVSLGYNSLKILLSNTMLYGAYRDNPSYCEAYIDKETFDKIQEIMQRNVKENTAENRAYIFSGLVICPHCGNRLSGNTTSEMKKTGRYYYKKYRCAGYRINHKCTFNKAVSENVLERMMLSNIEQYLEDAKIRAFQVRESEEEKIPQYDIEDIHNQIDRLNYSWQTGKIRTVEKYEADYAELLELLEKAEAERTNVPQKDFGKVEAILHSGWEAIYGNLDEAYKRAFWRSFVQSIEIDWTTKKKEIVRVNFF